MLLELKVSNFAIIENVQVSFSGGLNILSGETGAGKSVLLKSLSLLMGQKSSTASVRQGCDNAVVEGVFDLAHRPDIVGKLAEVGIDTEDDQLVVRRVLSSQGKSRVYLNESLSSLLSLRSLVSPLVEIAGPSAAPLIELTGQNESRHLLSTPYHMDLLDRFAGNIEQRNSYQELFEQRQGAIQELEDIQTSSRERAQRLDFLKYQQLEIEKLDLAPGQEVNLEASVKKMKNVSRLASFLESAEASLYGDDDSALARLHRIIQDGQEISRLDPEFSSNLSPLQEAKNLIDEAMFSLRDYCRNLDSDPDSLAKAEEKLSELRSLQRKYGSGVTEILEALGKIEKEISYLESANDRLGELTSTITELDKKLLTIAKKLHKKRVSAAELLAKEVNEELKDLNMKGVIFHVDVEQVAELNSRGHSQVEFLTSQGKSNKLPMAKTASGGELSRILLSLKQVVGTSEQPRTYLFDEVDTGVSGPTAEKVGRKLKSMSKGQQVICVTHLPQVAIFADTHFYIHKDPKASDTQMAVSQLKKKDRVQEIARLISGETISASSVKHAEQLLKECR